MASAWSEGEVGDWLRRSNLAEYIPAFEKAKVNGEMLFFLDDKSFKLLGVDGLHLQRLLMEIKKLNASTVRGPSSTGSTGELILGKYQPIKRIGKGSFGYAVLVRRVSDGKLFVAKHIELEGVSEKEKADSMKEIEVFSKIPSHPNIVEYLEHAVDANERITIIMEYADAGDLQGFLKARTDEGRPLSEAEALAMLAQLCLALRHLHSHHILHRDLKDVWSLGCIAYEMCALRHAFDAGSLKDLMHKIVKGEPAPIDATLFSEDMRTLIASMMSKRAENRPTIAQVLATPVVSAALLRLRSSVTVAEATAGGDKNAELAKASGVATPHAAAGAGVPGGAEDHHWEWVSPTVETGIVPGAREAARREADYRHMSAVITDAIAGGGGGPPSPGSPAPRVAAANPAETVRRHLESQVGVRRVAEMLSVARAAPDYAALRGALGPDARYADMLQQVLCAEAEEEDGVLEVGQGAKSRPR